MRLSLELPVATSLKRKGEQLVSSASCLLLKTSLCHLQRIPLKQELMLLTRLRCQQHAVVDFLISAALPCLRRSWCSGSDWISYFSRVLCSRNPQVPLVPCCHASPLQCLTSAALSNLFWGIHHISSLGHGTRLPPHAHVSIKSFICVSLLA